MSNIVSSYWKIQNIMHLKSILNYVVVSQHRRCLLDSWILQERLKIKIPWLSLMWFLILVFYKRIIYQHVVSLQYSHSKAHFYINDKITKIVLVTRVKPNLIVLFKITRVVLCVQHTNANLSSIIVRYSLSSHCRLDKISRISVVFVLVA